MNIDTLRALSVSELNKKMYELRIAQFALRMQVNSGENKNHHKIREMRKNVARVKTLINEKQRG